VLNIPHASVGGLGIARWDDTKNLITEVRRWTDWYTDMLFIPDKREGIQIMTSDYSRFVVDVERLVNDPLEKIGQGIVYKKFNGLHRTFEGREEIEMFRYHANYIRDLRLMLDEHSLLIDCHSFPSDLSDVDICIGYNEDWSKPSDFVIDLVKTFFEHQGYKVGINTPYSNSIAPETGYVYNSIMIEVNKRLYMNEQTLELTDGFLQLHKCLESLYSILNRYWEEL
jgi:N-formylglutamate amidohydrolase